MGVKVKDNDQNYKELVNTFKKLKKKKTVVVGVLGSKATERKRGSDGDVTVVDVASWNEFGTDKIPARSFLRSTYEQDKAKFLGIISRLRNEIALGKMDIKKALSIVGEYAQAQVQKKITDGGDPFIPNTPTTAVKKGSTSPLIDTGQLRQSIRYEVRDGE